MNILCDDDEIIFKDYSSKDFDGFVDCINDFYKGGYPYKEYLDKEFLSKELSTGNMIVVVSQNKKGEIIGTSAAQKVNGTLAGSIILLLRTIRSDYRGKGLGTKQEEFLFSKIHSLFSDALCIYADVMTHDSISQKTLLKKGFSLTGLRMFLYKNEIIVPSLPFETGTKMTQAIYTKPIVNHSVCLYAPEERKEFIKNIYNDMNVEFTFLSEKKEQDEKGKYDLHISEKHQNVNIDVIKPGKDYRENVINTFKEYINNKFTCTCYINASYCDIIDIVRDLEKIGFYFSGIKPLNFIGEFIVMSHTANCMNRIENISVPEEKQRFKEYITRGINYVR